MATIKFLYIWISCSGNKFAIPEFPEHDIQMYTIVAIIAFLCLHDVAKKTTHECCKPVRHMLSMSCES